MLSFPGLKWLIFSVSGSCSQPGCVFQAIPIFSQPGNVNTTLRLLILFSRFGPNELRGKKSYLFPEAREGVPDPADTLSYSLRRQKNQASHLSFLGSSCERTESKTIASCLVLLILRAGGTKESERRRK